MFNKIISYEESLTVELKHPHPTERLPMYKEADERGDCSLVMNCNGSPSLEVLCRIEGMGNKRIGILIIPYEREISVYAAIEDSNDDLRGGVFICDIEDIHTPLDAIIAKAKAEMNKCPVCGKAIPISEQKSYSFAGRCCDECLPAMKAKHEYPGWTK